MVNNVSEEAQFSKEREHGSSDREETQSLGRSKRQINKPAFLNDYLLLSHYYVSDSYALAMESDHSTD